MTQYECPVLALMLPNTVPLPCVVCAGLAAVLLGVCLINAPGSPMQQQQQPQQPPAAGGAPTFDQLLDVLLSRVGLSQFYGAVDEMKASPAFQAARSAPRLPAHITRAMATALLQAEAAGAATAAVVAAAAAGGKGGQGPGLVGGALGLLSHAADAGGGVSTAAGQHMAEVQPYDQAFAKHAEEVAAAVQQLTLNAFSAGGGSSTTTPTPSPAGIAPKHIPGTLPIPSAPPVQFAPTSILAGHGPPQVIPPGGLAGVGSPLKQQQHHQQQHHPLPIPGPPQHHQIPGSQLLPAAVPLPLPHQQPTTPPAQPPQPPLQPPHQQQQLVFPEGSPLAAVAAQLAGDTSDQKLLAALDAILQLQGQVEELRSRNRSLAEDLIRVSQSKPGLAGGHLANGGAVANGVQEGTPEAAQAEVDARVAAQLRASRAEMEAGALK